ncbi:hypothetical protein SAMN05660209_04655 [Geodermatophilus africanus]|uniref:Esterase n=1 Tax=Geodermatophilus africanus TaxID=1137993 RepID=A0A1H3Q942_9ACTN|nr:hypothetical protein [Geodermatophilus africanus]SDZ09535.1 hypothetical protein SAMN05660209_04655 [Geodermatophilus africanus]
MRSSLSTAGRRASVLAAAALVSLTTAACGPADLQVGTAGAAGQAASSQAATDRPLAIGDAATAPSAAVPTPALTSAAPAPTTPAQTQPQAPVAQPTESQVEAVDEQQAAVPAEAAPGAPQAAAPAAPGRWSRDSSSGRSAGTSAAAPAPVAGAAAAPAAAGTSTGGSGGTFTDQARRSFTAGNGQAGNYLLYAAGVDPTKPVGLVVYVDGTGEYGVDNPTASYALGGSSGLVATSRARNMITLAVESPNQSCECWHTGDTSAYADFLAGLIENQLGKYPVSELWLSGFSSGAQEITRFLVPRHPELMRLGGGWVVFGGGGPPADGGSAVTAARMAGVRGHWFTGTADTSVPLTASWGAQAGERFYAGRGVVTSSEYPAGVGHALDGRLGRTVGQLIDAS